MNFDINYIFLFRSSLKKIVVIWLPYLITSYLTIAICHARPIAAGNPISICELGHLLTAILQQKNAMKSTKTPHKFSKCFNILERIKR